MKNLDDSLDHVHGGLAAPLSKYVRVDYLRSEIDENI